MLGLCNVEAAAAGSADSEVSSRAVISDGIVCFMIWNVILALVISIAFVAGVNFIRSALTQYFDLSELMPIRAFSSCGSACKSWPVDAAKRNDGW